MCISKKMASSKEETFDGMLLAMAQQHEGGIQQVPTLEFQFSLTRLNFLSLVN